MIIPSLANVGYSGSKMKQIERVYNNLSDEWDRNLLIARWGLIVAPYLSLITHP